MPLERRRRTPRGWARVGHLLRTDRRARGVLAGLGLIVVLLGIWAGYSLHAARTDLKEASDQAAILRHNLGEGDIDGARRAFGRMEDALERVDDRTHGRTWGLLEHSPVIGDDLTGIADVSRALRDLGQQGIRPLVDRTEALAAGSFAPHDHAFPLRRIVALREAAASAHAGFVTASERIDDVDPSGFLSALRSQVERLQDQVEEAESYLDTAERATQVMPDLLGASGPRNYLFVFQNNAELRATGGLPSAMSLVHADRGRVHITTQASSGDFRQLAQPILPLRRDEQEVFGRQVGTYFLDANFVPDFPRAAQLWRAGWEQRFSSRLDGVFVVDPVALSYLLAATGPIQVGDVALTADNVVPVVENLVYVNVPDPVAQDEFFKNVARAAFDAFADGRGDPVGLVRGLARGVEERRVLVHSFVPRDQAVLDGTLIAGHFPVEASRRPQVGVYLNDGTGAKMSYYLDYTASASPVSCVSERQRLTGSFVVTADTPTNIRSLPVWVVGNREVSGIAHPPGTQYLTTVIVGPVGGTLDSVTYNGRREPDPLVQRYHGREVLVVSVVLEPQAKVRIDFAMTSGPGQTGPIDVTVTPGSHGEDESSVTPAGCI